MPYHRPTRISCSIYPTEHPSHSIGLPFQEHHIHSASSAVSGAIQQIATIESTPDTSFEIRVELEPTSYSLGHRPEAPDEPDDFLIFVILDGVEVQRSKRHRSQTTATRISGVFTPDGNSRQFRFAKLQLVDPDDETLPADARKDIQENLCSDEKICQSLGTIRVDIVRCELGPKRPVIQRASGGSGGRGGRESLRTSNQMKFSEHTKKVLLTDTAGLSDANHRNERGSSSNARPFNGCKRTARCITWQDKHPFIQFIFEYSSKAVLEAKGIIVRQIAPPPPPPPRPPPNYQPPLAMETKPDIKKKEGFVDFGDITYIGLVPCANSIEEKKPKPAVTPKADREVISIDADDDDEPKASSSNKKRPQPIKPEDSGKLEELKKPKLQEKEKPVVIDLTLCIDSDSD